MAPIDSGDEDLAEVVAEVVAEPAAIAESGAVNATTRETTEPRSRLLAFEKLMQLGDADAGYRACEALCDSDRRTDTMRSWTRSNADKHSPSRMTVIKSEH